TYGRNFHVLHVPILIAGAQLVFHPGTGTFPGHCTPSKIKIRRSFKDEYRFDRRLHGRTTGSRASISPLLRSSFLAID
ncbi:hypothetical protein ACLOJK_030579, partial [Asimina triloba]